MFAVDLVSRWLHIIPAIVLVGGVIFMRFAYVPAIAGLAEDVRDEINEKVRRRWSIAVMICALLLLVSGLWNLTAAMRSELPSWYMMLFLAKLFLALGVLFVSSLLSGKSENAAKIRENLSFWLNINVVMAILLVLAAGAMRLAQREDKKEKPEETTMVAATSEYLA